jgi:hypothetical protein
MPVNVDVLTTRVVGGIAVITLTTIEVAKMTSEYG